MSLAVFFGVLAATSLVGALAALWGSLRAAFGGEVTESFSSDATPERAALLDEKTSLLRAIKDLQYEHQVGKLDQADYERLDRAYRARAKEVLELLDRDVRPYREKAEALLGALSDAPKPKKKAKKAAEAPAESPAPSAEPTETPEPAEARDESDDREPDETDEPAETPSASELAQKLEALDPEKRAKAEAFLRELTAAAKAEPKEDE